MTMVLLERRDGFRTLIDATDYLVSHGFPRQHIHAGSYCFTEVVKAHPYLVTHSSGRQSDGDQGALYTFIVDEFLATIECLNTVEGWQIEATIYGPGVITAAVSSGPRRRAVRI